MNVQRGDIGVVRAGNERFLGSIEEFEGDHTFIVTEDGELKRTTKTIHLTWGGLYPADFEDHGLASIKYIFRCLRQPLASRAAGYAETWLRKMPAKDVRNPQPDARPRDTYSQDRARAVKHDVGKKGNLPYEFDALRRSLKWQRRVDAPFTNNRGATCAAWVVACYQAAAFSDPSIEAPARDGCWALVSDSRIAKPQRAERVLAHGKDKADYRELKNLGAKAPDAMTRALALLKRGQQVADKDFLERLLTKALVVDGRFLHTDGLVRRIKDDSQNWKVFTRPDPEKQPFVWQ